MREYTFKNFELFLYETLKSLQKPGTFNFQNISEVYREVCVVPLRLTKEKYIFREIHVRHQAENSNHNSNWIHSGHFNSLPQAERRLSPDFSRCDKALYCTTKSHRCLHAAHAYTGIPCAAYSKPITRKFVWCYGWKICEVFHKQKEIRAFPFICAAFPRNQWLKDWLLKVRRNFQGNRNHYCSCCR